MKHQAIVFLLLFLLPSGILFAQKAKKINYSDGVDDLLEMKSASEDIARAIKMEWDHSSPEYKEAKQLYRTVQNSVNNMITAFEARIRSGATITEADIERYVQQTSERRDQFFGHYNANSPQGGTHALFGLDKIFDVIKKIVTAVADVVGGFKERQIQQRLNDMHAALDPCRLSNWDEIM